MTPSLRVTGAALVLAAALLCATPAAATPGTDITAVTLTQAQIPAGLLPFVAGTDLVVREITIAPGGSDPPITGSPVSSRGCSTW